MKFSNFLFPDSMTAADDGRVIDETLQEARLTDELGYDTIWLAEHHFDGIVAYVDPVSFAAALAVATKQAKIGFAVAQMALHHPVRFAEQIALIDHLAKGRLIVGLGRGTAYNIYDYQGYGIDHTKAQAIFEEAEAVMFEAWKGQPMHHKGEHLQRPLAGTAPDYLHQAASLRDPSGGERTRDAGDRASRQAVHDERAEQRHRRSRACSCTSRRCATSAWTRPRSRPAPRNAGSGATSTSPKPTPRPNASPCRPSSRCTSIASPCASASTTNRAPPSCRCRARDAPPPPHASVENGLVYGSPATVAEKLAPIAATGVGGVIIQFRLGTMPYEQAAQSLTLFRDKVIPALEAKQTIGA